MSEKATYSPIEFAAEFGKSQAWAYRLIYSKKIKVIKDYGNMMIPASEKDRILNSANYNDLIAETVTTKKRGRGRPKKRTLWVQHLNDRRKMKTRTKKGKVTSFASRKRDTLSSSSPLKAVIRKKST